MTDLIPIDAATELVDLAFARGRRSVLDSLRSLAVLKSELNGSTAGVVSALMKSGVWDEQKHPRGQPENAGEFGSGGETATKEPPKRVASKWSYPLKELKENAVEELAGMVRNNAGSLKTVTADELASGFLEDEAKWIHQQTQKKFKQKGIVQKDLSRAMYLDEEQLGNYVSSGRIDLSKLASWSDDDDAAVSFLRNRNSRGKLTVVTTAYDVPVRQVLASHDTWEIFQKESEANQYEDEKENLAAIGDQRIAKLYYNGEEVDDAKDLMEKVAAKPGGFVNVDIVFSPPKPVSKSGSIRSTVIEKAFQESQHPRDRNGKFIGKQAIDTLAHSPEGRAQLHANVKPGDESKLDAAISAAQGEKQHGHPSVRIPNPSSSKPMTPKAEKMAGTVEFAQSLAAAVKAGNMPGDVPTMAKDLSQALQAMEPEDFNSLKAHLGISEAMGAQVVAGKMLNTQVPSAPPPPLPKPKTMDESLDEIFGMKTAKQRLAEGETDSVLKPSPDASKPVGPVNEKGREGERKEKNGKEPKETPKFGPWSADDLLEAAKPLRREMDESAHDPEAFLRAATEYGEWLKQFSPDELDGLAKALEHETTPEDRHLASKLAIKALGRAKPEEGHTGVVHNEDGSQTKFHEGQAAGHVPAGQESPAPSPELPPADKAAELDKAIPADTSSPVAEIAKHLQSPTSGMRDFQQVRNRLAIRLTNPEHLDEVARQVLGDGAVDRLPKDQRRDKLLDSLAGLAQSRAEAQHAPVKSPPLDARQHAERLKLAHVGATTAERDVFRDDPIAKRNIVQQRAKYGEQMAAHLAKNPELADEFGKFARPEPHVMPPTPGEHLDRAKAAGETDAGKVVRDYSEAGGHPADLYEHLHPEETPKEGETASRLSDYRKRRTDRARADSDARKAVGEHLAEGKRDESPIDAGSRGDGTGPENTPETGTITSGVGEDRPKPGGHPSAAPARKPRLSKTKHIVSWQTPEGEHRQSQHTDAADAEEMKGVMERDKNVKPGSVQTHLPKAAPTASEPPSPDTSTSVVPPKPHEMTQAEYATLRGKQAAAAKTGHAPAYREGELAGGAEHRTAVAIALANGERVPKHVLDEYAHGGVGFTPADSERLYNEGKQIVAAREEPEHKYNYNPTPLAEHTVKGEESRQALRGLDKPHEISGYTFPYKAAIREIGGKYDASRRAWYVPSDRLSELPKEAKVKVRPVPEIQDRVSLRQDPPLSNKPITDEQLLIEHHELAEQKLTDSERAAIGHYTFSGFQDLNPQMIKHPNQHHRLTEPNKKLLSELESAIGKAGQLPKPINVNRSIYLTPKASAAMVRDIEKKQSRGEELQFPSVASTTLHQPLEPEEGGIVFRIKAKSGIYADPLSANKKEKEILLSHKAKYKVLSVEPATTGGHYVSLEQL